MAPPVNRNYGGFQDVYAPQLAYGNSGNNVPQVFTVTTIHNLPRLKSAPYWQRAILGGCQYSDMTTIQTGNSMTLGLSTPHSGLASRPNIIGQVSYPRQWRATGDRWFNTTSFAQPAPGYFDSARNDTLMGPGVVVFNMAGYKTFPIAERASIQFRVKFFISFHHTSPNNPNTSFGHGDFGMITGAREACEGEGSLKFTF